jgi:hypothetical protein
LRYLLPRLTGRKLQYQRMLTDLAVFFTAGWSHVSLTKSSRYPTSVFTAAVISASAFFASAKYMLVLGLTYSSLSMPA